MIETEGLAERVPPPRAAGPRHPLRRCEALGLALFAKTEPSPALTAVVAPRGIDSEAVLSTYSTSHNITIAGGQGETKGKIFRLGHMGYVGDFDVITALAALEQVLHELGQPVDFGAARPRGPEGLRRALSAMRDPAPPSRGNRLEPGAPLPGLAGQPAVRHRPGAGGVGGAAARGHAVAAVCSSPLAARARHRRHHRGPARARGARGGGLQGDGLRRVGGPHAGRGARRASPTPLRAWAETPHEAAWPGAETAGHGARRGPWPASRRLRAGAPGADRLPRLPRDHRPHPDPRSPRARARPALVASSSPSTGISELEFRDDWTTLHRMNSLIHLTDGAVA